MNRRRYLGWVAVLVTVGLIWRARALWIGFITDDYLQLAMVEGSFPVTREPWDLFRFVQDDPAERRALMGAGFLPWWAAEDLRLGMLRPLASLTFVVDVQLFGTHAVGHHLHSAMWWVVMVSGAAAVLGAVAPPRLALCAFALFVADESHGPLLTWLANRSASMATAAGLWALWAHLRWRIGGWRPGRPLSIALAALGLGCGEYAVPVLAYLVAFEWAGMGDATRDRVRALVPFAVAVGLYLAIRGALHLGMQGSGIYVDPTRDPAGFAIALVGRGPALVADLVLGVPARWWNLGSPWTDAILGLHLFDAATWRRLPDWQTVHVVIGVMATVAAVFAVRFGARAQRSAVRRHVSWLALGAAGSIVPVVGSYPSSRLLLAAQLGTSVVVATAVVRGVSHLRRWLRRPRRRWVGGAAVGITAAWIHLWGAPHRSLDRLVHDWNLHTATRRALLHPRLDALAVEHPHWVILSAQDQSTAQIAPYLRRAHGRPAPVSAWLLSAAPHPHDLVGVDARTFDLVILGGTWLQGGFERLFREPDEEPLHKGDAIDAGGFTATVLETRGRGLRRVRFRFDTPPGPDTAFVHATAQGLVAIEPPGPGARIRLQRPAYVTGATARAPAFRSTLRRDRSGAK